MRALRVRGKKFSPGSSIEKNAPKRWPRSSAFRSACTRKGARFCWPPRAAMALLLPAKLWGALSGGGVRALIRDKMEIVALEDMTESRSGFDAAVYPSLLVGRRRVAREVAQSRPIAAAAFRNGAALQWE